MCLAIGDTEPVPGDQVVPDQLSPQQDAAIISLPPSLFERITNRSYTGLFFGLYETATLFPVGRGNADSRTTKHTQVGSHIVAATVGPGTESDFQDLQEPVTSVFHLQPTQGMVNANFESTPIVIAYTSPHSHLPCICSSWHLAQRFVLLGILVFKTGPLKAVQPVSVKMELSLAAATISPTLLCL